MTSMEKFFKSLKEDIERARALLPDATLPVCQDSDTKVKVICQINLNFCIIEIQIRKPSIKEKPQGSIITLWLYCPVRWCLALAPPF